MKFYKNSTDQIKRRPQGVGTSLRVDLSKKKFGKTSDFRENLWFLWKIFSFGFFSVILGFCHRLDFCANPACWFRGGKKKKNSMFLVLPPPPPNPIPKNYDKPTDRRILWYLKKVHHGYFESRRRRRLQMFPSFFFFQLIESSSLVFLANFSAAIYLKMPRIANFLFSSLKMIIKTNLIEIFWTSLA